MKLKRQKCPLYACNKRGTVKIPGHDSHWLLCESHADRYALRHRDVTRALYDWIEKRVAERGLA